MKIWLSEESEKEIIDKIMGSKSYGVSQKEIFVHDDEETISIKKEVSCSWETGKMTLCEDALICCNNNTKLKADTDVMNSVKNLIEQYIIKIMESPEITTTDYSELIFNDNWGIIHVNKMKNHKGIFMTLYNQLPNIEKKHSSWGNDMATHIIETIEKLKIK